MKLKKSQVWYVELMFSILVVSLTTTLFMINLSNKNNFGFSTDLVQDASYISESLMSMGIPENWDNSTVKRVGVLNSNNRINETKMTYLYSMPVTKVYQLFDVESKFFIELYNGTVIIPFAGKNSAGRISSNSTKVSSISRYSIYKSSVVELRVSTWEK